MSFWSELLFARAACNYDKNNKPYKKKTPLQITTRFGRLSDACVDDNITLHSFLITPLALARFFVFGFRHE